MSAAEPRLGSELRVGSDDGSPRVNEGSRHLTARDEGGVEDPLLVDELLVEEISIDGMCGVY